MPRWHTVLCLSKGPQPVNRNPGCAVPHLVEAGWTNKARLLQCIFPKQTLQLNCRQEPLMH